MSSHITTWPFSRSCFSCMNIFQNKLVHIILNSQFKWNAAWWRRTSHNSKKSEWGNDKYVLCFQLKLTDLIWFFHAKRNENSSWKRVDVKKAQHQKEKKTRKHATSLTVESDWNLFSCCLNGLWVIEGIKNLTLLLYVLRVARSIVSGLIWLK